MVNDPEWTKLILSKHFENFHIRTVSLLLNNHFAVLRTFNIIFKTFINDKYLQNKRTHLVNFLYYNTQFILCWPSIGRFLNLI